MAEEALERDLLAYRFIKLFTLETPFSIITFMTHILQSTAILKLLKLVLRLLATSNRPKGARIEPGDDTR